MSTPATGLSIEEQRAIPLVNQLLQRAVKERSSDIHLEPRENYLRVRYRIDGMLQQRPSVLEQVRFAVVQRIKVLCQMDIAERRVPQDGSFKLLVDGVELGFRVSTFPTEFGEKCVLRVLNGDRQVGRLDSLGMPDFVTNALRAQMRRHSGMLLAVGPAGSGKTSTLYSILHEIQSAERNIVTLEDPIEHRFDGITQGQVNTKASFTFETGLRAILRQDPDVIMVGEMRDRETASIAFKAALTGHLVLSTLHTENSAEAVTRLADIGLERYLIGACLRAVVAQRLVRVLCTHCRKAVQADGPTRKLLGVTGDAPVIIYEPGVCVHCASTGFMGRTGVYELLEVDEEIQEYIKGGGGKAGIEQRMRAKGVPTLRELGWRLVKQGYTTPTEVLRVL